MAVRGEGLAVDDAAAAADSGSAPAPASQKIVYVLHPNCAIEDV